MKKSILFLLTIISVNISCFSSVTCTGGSWSGGDFISAAPYGYDGLYILSTGSTALEIFSDTNKSLGGIVAADKFMPDGTTGEAYAFGLLGNQNADIENLIISDCDLTGKNGKSGAITVNFSGVSNLSYIAYCGGELLSYTYDGDNLSITYEATTAAGSASNPSGGQKLFGLVILCNTEVNFGGAVFRTNMYWEDLKFQEAYGNENTNMLPGCNFAGENTKEVNFDYYIQQSILEGLSIKPVTNIEKCSFRFTKSTGEEINPNKTVNYYTTDGQMTTWGGSTISGSSNFDFNGNGSDNYVNVSLSNSSWSKANGYVYGEEETAIEEQATNNAVIFVSKDRSLNVVCEACIGSVVGLYTIDGRCIEKTTMITSNYSYKQLSKGTYILQLGTSSQQFIVK